MAEEIEYVLCANGHGKVALFRDEGEEWCVKCYNARFEMCPSCSTYALRGKCKLCRKCRTHGHYKGRKCPKCKVRSRNRIESARSFARWSIVGLVGLAFVLAILLAYIIIKGTEVLVYRVFLEGHGNWEYVGLAFLVGIPVVILVYLFLSWLWGVIIG